MTIPTTTRQWLLREKPFGPPQLQGDHATFELTTTNLPPIKPNQVLVKTLYLSNDPTQRRWISPSINPDRLYIAPADVGSPMKGYGIAEVISGGPDTHAPGTLVIASTGWSEHVVLDANNCSPIPDVPDGLRPSALIGPLGMTGLTAYYGLIEVVKTTKDDVVVISGAAGATGSMAVQIAKKIIGCRRVIGIAGSEEKCRWVESLGADICINYKKDSFEEDLIAATEGFVEVYFDNVAGRTLDLMFRRMKRDGRIAACGSISGYHDEGTKYALQNFGEIVSNRLHIHGFIVLDYLHKQQDVQHLLTQAWKDGIIKVDATTQTVVDSSFEDISRVWLRLFDGSSVGKLTTHLVE